MSLRHTHTFVYSVYTHTSLQCFRCRKTEQHYTFKNKELILPSIIYLIHTLHTFFLSFLIVISLSGACFRTALIVPFQLNLPTIWKIICKILFHGTTKRVKKQQLCVRDPVSLHPSQHLVVVRRL